MAGEKTVLLPMKCIYTMQGICMLLATILMLGEDFKNGDAWLTVAIVFIGFIGGTYAVCHVCKSIFTFIGGIAFAAISAGIVTWWHSPDVTEWAVLFGAGFGFFTAWRVIIGRHYEIIE